LDGEAGGIYDSSCRAVQRGSIWSVEALSALCSGLRSPISA